MVLRERIVSGTVSSRRTVGMVSVVPRAPSAEAMEDIWQRTHGVDAHASLHARAWQPHHASPTWATRTAPEQATRRRETSALVDIFGLTHATTSADVPRWRLYISPTH